MLEHTAYHDCLSGELVGFLHRLLRHAHLQPGSTQTLHDCGILRVLEESHHALGNHLPHVVDSHKVVDSGEHQRVDRAESERQFLSHCLAHIRNRERKHHPFERHLLRRLDAAEYAPRRELAATPHDCQFVVGKVVDVSHILHQSHRKQLFGSFLSDSVDVHHPPSHEMLYAPRDLWTASVAVRTHPCRLALVAHQRRAADRAILHELQRQASGLASRKFDPHDFRYDFAALLHIYVVAVVDVELAYDVLVVKRGALHDCA
ncbi:unknown [Prevotella sp. CAG:279]|nr:unknown [Prevotella sp. CAG:279]